MPSRILLFIACLMPWAAPCLGQNSLDKLIEHAAELVDRNADSALLLCRKALPQCKAHTSQRANVLQTQGNALFTLGKNDEAISAFRLAVADARAARDTMLWANALSDMGVVYRVSERPDSALMLYNEALTLFSHTGDREGEAHLLTSIAVLYANTSRLNEAIPYARKAYHQALAAGEIETVMYAGSTLGIILYKAGKPGEGIAVERDMVGVAEKKRLPRYMLKTYASIIEMHYHSGQRDSAFYYMDKGKTLLPSVPKGSVEALGFMEECYVILAASGRYRESLAIQQEIVKLRGAGTYMPMDKLYARMARNYRALGDSAHMANCYEQAIATADSLRTAEIDEQLSEFDVRYQTAWREAEIARLQAEKAQMEMRWMVAIFAALLLIGALIVWIVIRKRREETARIRARLNGVETERARLARDLHDGVCNDLLGIALTLQSHPTPTEETVELLRGVRDEVRNISHELMPPQTADATLAMMLADYAAKSEGLVAFTATNGADCTHPDTSYQLYRMVQELCSNKRRHGHATHIDIILSNRPNLCVTISDNATPCPAQTPHNGIGTETLQGRAQMIGATLTTEQKGQGSSTKITVFRDCQ